jgi:hypothetical protein
MYVSLNPTLDLQKLRASKVMYISSQTNRGWWRHPASWSFSQSIHISWWWKPVLSGIKCKVKTGQLQFQAKTRRKAVVLPDKKSIAEEQKAQKAKKAKAKAALLLAQETAKKQSVAAAAAVRRRRRRRRRTATAATPAAAPVVAFKPVKKNSLRNGMVVTLATQQHTVGGQPKWVVVGAGKGYIALKSAKFGLPACSHQGKRVPCTAQHVPAVARMLPILVKGSTIVLKQVNTGKYCSQIAAGKANFTCKAKTIGAAEKFTFLCKQRCTKGGVTGVGGSEEAETSSNMMGEDSSAVESEGWLTPSA